MDRGYLFKYRERCTGFKCPEYRISFKGVYIPFFVFQKEKLTSLFLRETNGRGGRVQGEGEWITL